MRETIEVALASDQKFLMGLEVTAISMAHYVNRDCVLRLNILDGGISDDSFEDFTHRVLRVNPQCEFRRFKITEADFSAYPSWAGNRMTYARLVLPDLMPNEKHVIYSDCDILWATDIADLWNQKDDTVALQSVLDCEKTRVTESAWFSKCGMDVDSSRYFCAGMIMMNLEIFRREKISQQVFDFLKKYPDTFLPDQNALNYVLRGRTRLVEHRFDTLSLEMTSDDIRSGCAVHYPNESPWKPMTSRSDLLTDPKMLWHFVYARIHGMSVWQSLRQYYSPWQIIWSRSLYIVCSVQFVKAALGLFKYIGFPGTVAKLRFWCRRIDYSYVKTTFLQGAES